MYETGDSICQHGVCACVHPLPVRSATYSTRLPQFIHSECVFVFVCVCVCVCVHPLCCVSYSFRLH